MYYLICRTFEYVTLYVKRDFADVIKLSIFKWSKSLDYVDGLNVIRRILIRQKAGQSQKMKWMVEVEEAVWALRMEEGDPKQMNVGNL